MPNPSSPGSQPPPAPPDTAWLDHAKSTLDLITVALRGLSLAGSAAAAQLGTTKANTVFGLFATAADVIAVVRGHIDDKIGADEIKAHLQAQIDLIDTEPSDLDRADQSAIDKKFPTG